MKANFEKRHYDAIVIGAGPNGLSCAITLAQKGLRVLVVEKSEKLGGGAKTEELTLPGFFSDVCSAVHPLALASPFFKTLPLQEHGLRWIHSPAEIAHPLDDGSVLLLKKSVHETAAALGVDQGFYNRFYGSFISHFDEFMKEILGPIFHNPKYIGLLAKFGIHALSSADLFSRAHYRDEKNRALFIGIAAHSSAPLTSFASSAIGLALQIAGHGAGWPIPQGGAKNISRALASYLKSLGGEIITAYEVLTLDDLPSSDLIFFDQTPRQILKIAGFRLSDSVAKSFVKYRYGPGVFKMDWALSSPIPWKNSDCYQSATIHLGGSAQEIIESEKNVNQNILNARPFVLLSQPTLFDSTRAPSGSHIAWAYCHVPHGSDQDMTEIIENQVERFAPGFKKVILKRQSISPKDLENRNPNLVGGDIFGGLVNARQIFFRPRVTMNPYSLGDRQLWICSSSTPPGPGVHGMCGYHAAMAALR